MSEVQEKVAKAKTTYTSVTMADGRVVQFPGERQTSKAVLFDEETKKYIGVRFDYVNGETRTLSLADLPEDVVNYSACHGLSQKVGDASAGVKEVADIVLATDDMIAQLIAGSWASERAAGDSMAGASVVIKALMEASGKDMNTIKAFLDKKLADSKAAAEASGGTAITRQKLYASFRDPTSKVGQIIRRLEEEKAAKSSVVNADEVLGELAQQ